MKIYYEGPKSSKFWLHLRQWNKTSTNTLENKELSKQIPLRWRFFSDISHSCGRPTVQILPLSKSSLLSPTVTYSYQILFIFHKDSSIERHLNIALVCSLVRDMISCVRINFTMFVHKIIGVLSMDQTDKYFPIKSHLFWNLHRWGLFAQNILHSK